jgi:hypothetical protein
MIVVVRDAPEDIPEMMERPDMLERQHFVDQHRTAGAGDA